MRSLKEKLFFLLSEHSVTLGLVTEPSPALLMARLIHLQPVDIFTIRQCQQMIVKEYDPIRLDPYSVHAFFPALDHLERTH